MCSRRPRQRKKRRFIKLIDSRIKVKTATARKVAILGARFGNLAVEEQMLGPLGIELDHANGENDDEIVEAAKDAQVILCGGAPRITAAVIRQLDHLEAVVRYGIGVDAIDVAECSKRGIYVANVPDYCIEEVATHALSLILLWTRKIPLARANTRSGRWDVAPIKPLQSPSDLILGLVGFGRIAQSLSRMARAIGFQVWVTDPYVASSRVVKAGARSVSLAQLIRRADFVSLHVPLSSKTRHMIDGKKLKVMKPTAYLVNTARGELIDEQALYEALVQGWIAGAAMDVMESEPPSRDHPLRTMDNVILTPHCAWYTERSQKELRLKACTEVIRVFRGAIPKNLVNKEALR
jgi:D-3-phosphoglycerate dehydrogenase